MQAKQALKLRPGERVYNKFYRREMIVKEIIPAATDRHPMGNFPLVLMEEDSTPYTYRLLGRVKP